MLLREAQPASDLGLRQIFVEEQLDHAALEVGELLQRLIEHDAVFNRKPEGLVPFVADSVDARRDLAPLRPFR